MEQTNETKCDGTEKKTKTHVDGLRPDEKAMGLCLRKRHRKRFNLQRYTLPLYVCAYELERVLLRDHWNDAES